MIPTPLIVGHKIDGGDRLIDVILNLQFPKILVLGNVFSSEECDQLVAQAAPKLERSLTVDNDATQAAQVVHEQRTSDGTFFWNNESELLVRLNARLTKICNWPLENAEPLQMLRYLPGGHYAPHYDYFDLATPGGVEHTKVGGNRVATMIIYLNDVDAGGATGFPQVGLQVAPRKGNAVFFTYPTAAPESKTLHSGEPVISGTKWITTRWLRERKYG